MRFVQLYVERTKSWLHNASCGKLADCGYGRFGYAQTLRLLPTDTSLELHVFADRSIVEAFGQGGRAAVTARVYPTLASSEGVGLYSNIEVDATVDAWALKSANVSEAAVLRDLQGRSARR